MRALPKHIEDGIGWTLETTADALVAFLDGLGAGAPVERGRPIIEGLDRQGELLGVAPERHAGRDHYSRME